MSASQDKKRRTDERALGTERRQVASQKEAKERKQSKIKWTVGSIIVVLLVAAILIGNSSLFYTARPALQVGDVKYSSAEVNYAYRSAYLTFCNQYGSYLSYVGLDTSKALDEQECRISDDFDTWDDYFKDAAEKNLVQVTALCDAAQKAGVTLDEDDQHEIDEQFSYLELTAKQYKYNSVSKYLQAAYGNGVTKKVVRHMLERSELATKYSQQQYDSYTYTPEEIAASYAENKNSCDTFNYQYYFVQADTEDSTDDDGNATSKTTDATMAAAKPRPTRSPPPRMTRRASLPPSRPMFPPRRPRTARAPRRASRTMPIPRLELQLRRVRRLALQRRPHCQRRDRRGAGKQRLLRRALREPR